MTVDVERMELRWARQALRRNSLDDIAFYDMLLQFGNEAFVPRFANVTLRFVTKFDRLLFWQLRVRGFELVTNLHDPSDRLFVQRFNLGSRGTIGKVDMCDNFDRLIDVIKDDESGGHHEEGFRQTGDRIVEGSSRFCDWFEVGYSVISDEANSAACRSAEAIVPVRTSKCGDLIELRISVALQLFLQDR